MSKCLEGHPFRGKALNMDHFSLNINNIFLLQHMATILIVSVANSSDDIVLENGNSWNKIIREKAKVKILSSGS